MKIFLALFFLGLLQGLTEFLPVSSSGHLVLFSKLFGMEESLFLSILLHVATLLSILVVLRKEVWQIVKHPFSAKTINLALACIPTCAIVLLVLPLVKSSFSGWLLCPCFAISAVLLWVAEALSKSKSGGAINKKAAFFMGMAQGFAVFPGISRSGATISAGLICGKDKQDVAKFSFLMSIPIILMSLFMEIVEICVGGQSIAAPALPTCISFLTAFVVGIFAIKIMLKLTAKANLKWFSLELIAMSILSAVLL